MLPTRELGVALSQVDPVTVRGPFFRTVAFKYLHAIGRGASNILSGVPGRDRGGRYNPAGGFLTTYLAESAETALSEGVRPFLISGVASALARPMVMLSVEGRLERVLDLLDPRVRRGPSVQRAGGHTIAVFPERVMSPSDLEVYDPDGLLRDRLPL
jgi:hypothetical protein